MAKDIGGTDRAPCCADLTTKELIKVVRTTEEQTPSFILNAFYRRVVRTDKDKVEIQSQHEPADRKLAPFVCPCVEAKPNEELTGWDSLEITPAYIKQKDALNACHKALAQKGFGEDCEARLTRRQRRDAHLARLLGRHSGRITRREEWMAVQGLLKGGYQVSGDRYPAQLVRMPRADDKDNMECSDRLGCGKSVLDYRVYELCNKGDLWNNCDADLASQIEDILAFGFSKFGASYTDVIVGADVAKAIRKNKNLKDLIKCAAEVRSNQLGNTDFNFGFQRPVQDQSSQYLGTLFVGSGLNFWTYRGTFMDLVTCDNAGNELPRDQWYTIEQPFIPRDVVLFIDNSDGPSGVDGTRFYGAIMDLDWDFATDGPQSRFVKKWSQPDPSCWHFMTQSAPLVLPCNANGALAICVVEGGHPGLCMKPKKGESAKSAMEVETDGLMAMRGYNITDRKLYDRKGIITDEQANERVKVTAEEHAEAVESLGGTGGVTVESPAFAGQ